MKNKFRKDFIHFLWDPEIDGKECLLADDIYTLQKAVEGNAGNTNLCIREKVHKACVSFDEENYEIADNAGCIWSFAYYDPALTMAQTEA